jgi:anti-sigma factor RsiW
LVKHAYFEELCALAPVGELSPSQLRELEAHIAECDECRQTTMDYDRLFRQVVPAVNQLDEEFIEARRSDIRASVLRSVAAIDNLPAAMKSDPPPFLPSPATFPKMRLSFALWAGVAAASLAATTFWLGAHFYGAGRRPQPVNSGIASAPTSVRSQPTPTPNPVAVDHSAKAQADPRNDQLLASLDAEREHSADLAKKLSVEDGELAQALAAQDALRAQMSQETQALAVTKADLDAKKVQLEQAQGAKSSDTATLVSLEVQVQDLTKKLNTQNASLDREHDLLSHGREIRDIIGARNLHIIDVYDTDTQGATRKPFARAFYTEGKSLVYYAYDLPQQRSEDAKYSYVAWGENNGNKASVKKIGILFHDDQTQKRWSLNFADPKVLAEIDSVFITLERTDVEAAEPKGKRMLTAYLGTSPNHP